MCRLARFLISEYGTVPLGISPEFSVQGVLAEPMQGCHQISISDHHSYRGSEGARKLNDFGAFFTKKEAFGAV